ncbi:hypothetical protein PCL_09409 [Purpureocillium lilacinum]|uniref:Uncharacterized protein n=1 Tax=Purpureocillium lilacinum TaxID=33203 RepID=A0A2U3EI20_PURLI|nr:hypothetical protein PCL_09409 [Purpureocillium lilacinum]
MLCHAVIGDRTILPASSSGLWMKGPLQALIAQAEAAPAGCDTLTRARRKQSFFRLACSFPPSGSPVALLARPPLVYRFIGRVPPAGAVRGRGACVSEVLKQGDLIAMAIRKTANSRPRAPRSRGVPLLRPHGQPASLLTPAMRFEFARVDEYEAGGRAGRHELSKASPSVPPPQAPAGHWDDWEGTLASAGNSGRDEGGAGRFTDGVMDLLFVVSCRVAPARAAPACLSTMPPSGTHRTYLTSFPAHQQRHPHRRLPGRPPITAPRRRNPPTLCRGRSRLGQSCAKTPPVATQKSSPCLPETPSSHHRPAKQLAFGIHSTPGHPSLMRRSVTCSPGLLESGVWRPTMDTTRYETRPRDGNASNSLSISRAHFPKLRSTPRLRLRIMVMAAAGPALPARLTGMQAWQGRAPRLPPPPPHLHGTWKAIVCGSTSAAAVLPPAVKKNRLAADDARQVLPRRA